MDINTIANRLIELIQANDYFTAYDELFHPNAKAIELQLAEMGLAQVKGIEAIKTKVGQLSAGIAELNQRTLSTPIVTDKHIAFRNFVKAKLKDGSDFQLNEICLYEVAEGKIISEQFIY